MANASLSTVLCHVRALAAHGGDDRSDAELLEIFLTRKDETAFAALVRRHGPMVLNTCRRVLRLRHDAEDAFQATFLILARKAALVRKRPALASWLYGTAYRTALSIQRAVRRRRVHEARARVIAPSDPSADLAWREVQLVLEEEIQRLPERYRAVFVLCCLESKPRTEVARLLNLKEGTVSSRLDHARKRLQAGLARRGVTLSGVLAATALTQPAASAALPATVLATTVRAAAVLAAGKGIASPVVSARVAALVERGLTTMFTAKQIMTALVVVGMLAWGAGLILGQRPGDPAPDQNRIQKSESAGARTEQADSPKTPSARLDYIGDPLPARSLLRLGSLHHFRPGQRVDSVACSPDGKTMALASRRAVTLWDLATGKECWRFQAPGFTALMENSAVAYSPDGKLLAAASSTAMTVHLWDVSTKKELHAFRHDDWVYHLAFAPNGKTLATTTSGSKENAIHLWDIAAGRKLRRFTGHPVGWDKIITSIAFSPDGQTLASGGYDSSVRLWEVAGKEIHHLKSPPIPGYRGAVGSVTFSMDGNLLMSAHGDGLIRVWDPTTGKKVRELKGHRHDVTSLALSPDGKVVASGGGDHTIRLWDLKSGKELRQIAGTDHKRGVFWLAFSPDGATLVSWGGLHTVRFWEVASGKECRRVTGHQGDLAQIHFAAEDGTLLSWGQDRTLRIWNLKTAQERCMPVGTNWGTDDQGVAFSPDGRLLALGSGEAVIDFWDVAAGCLIRKLNGHRKYITAVAFSPDGNTLASASGGDRSIRLWDPATGKELRQWEGIRKDRNPEDWIHTLVWSPNGKVLASGGNAKVIRLWDVATGKEIRTFDGHVADALPPLQRRPVYIAFSPDGKTVASACNDSEIRLWQPDSGKELRRLECPFEPDNGHVFAVAFSPTGRKLATTRQDGTVMVWEAATGRRIRTFRGHGADVSCLAFSRDGRRLASGSADSTILVWDLTCGATDGPRSNSDLSAEQVEKLWAQLAADDPAKADDALWRLVFAPNRTVPFLKNHLRPASATASGMIQALLSDLDSSSFAARKKASDELTKLGDAAAPALRKVLTGQPSLEVRRRVDSLLAALEAPTSTQLQHLRAIEILGYIGTPDAHELLRILATGAADARLTEEARASLDRLVKTMANRP
jgi:RNA polymerase sigma factor (sigma-70 family)